MLRRRRAREVQSQSSSLLLATLQIIECLVTRNFHGNDFSPAMGITRMSG